ncbi:ribonucleoside-diphosphate reductase subunit alpha [Thalassobacillus hwangdonensis]|uniref:Ribonucleoside-diphosphate reductase n=1 Tax=Thalassobacillus hwangdonensis TaxID=546108 RepID=A0ABW3L1Z6_9BACI
MTAAPQARWSDWIDVQQKRFPSLDTAPFKQELTNMNLEELEFEEQIHLLTLTTLSYINEREADWTFVAADLLRTKIYEETKKNRNQSYVYTGFHTLIKRLINEGIYSPFLLETYSTEDVQALEKVIDPEKDTFFTYIGLKTLTDRYLSRNKEKALLELPQERFMIIAMTLMAKENDEKRISLVKEAYWALSNLYMTVATPTLTNAGKTYGQLSSCFIDTVEDDLQSIFDSNTSIATLSKHGGGIGVYLGKIRSRGSDIKGFKGVSSGVLPWMKQLNNTAVSVDQLGQRQGAVAVYLDVWHKDIFPFLDSRLNNGDERQRTHDIFTGVCIPDLFMEAVENREDWHLFDPHEVRKVMGFSLEDFYDEQKGNGSFREKYEACVNHPLLSRNTVPAIDIMKRIMISQLETGTPYMFYRDEVNRMNPNNQAGMIYCSNLCTEITQNQSATIQEDYFTSEGLIYSVKRPGDFVVCNLSSINLGRAAEEKILKRLIPIQVRMLDNVIDGNTIPVLQATVTNHKYRGIGLGTFGWAHLLAKKKIKWESDEANTLTEELYETINFLTIQASADLAREKGSYPMFEGSDWHTGAYFEKRQLTKKGKLDWEGVKDQVQTDGLRNGYLMAIAPNASTSLIAGSTASIDPIYRKAYAEEKKDYKIPVTAPDLNEETFWYYKAAHETDQFASIKTNGIRQKYIDQSISFNLYVKNSIKAKELLELHLSAWKNGLKTTYYTRSTSGQNTDYECESCSS